MTRLFLLAGFALCAFGAAAETKADFEMVDANGDGFISESEFVRWKTVEAEASPADALIKFIEIDADASGMISETEFTIAMKEDDTEPDASETM